MSEAADALVVLAKEPRPGRVKTRLQRRFSANQAAQLAAAAIRDTQRAVRGSSARRRVLCWEGNATRWRDGFEIVPQRAGTLNQRLTGAFADLPQAGAERVLLIGMDTPQVSAALLNTSWDGCDTVLGLSDDGGFWAIGLRPPDAAAVFHGIEMSSPRTGSAQLARLLDLGLSVKLLPPLRDIDHPEDAAYVANCFPELEFSRLYDALAGPIGPERVFDRLYAGEQVIGDDHTRSVLPLDATRWCAQADEVDQLVVSRCRGPVLDLGCGPGRMVQALNESGVAALGVDMSAVAVAATRSRGALAIQARLAERLPGEGRWATVLLMDGNIGIGGDVDGLLRRCRALLAPGGTLVIEVDPHPARYETRRIRLVAKACAADLSWTRTGVAALRQLAGPLDLIVVEEWSAGDRSFLSLQLAA